MKIVQSKEYQEVVKKLINASEPASIDQEIKKARAEEQEKCEKIIDELKELAISLACKLESQLQRETMKDKERWINALKQAEGDIDKAEKIYEEQKEED